MTVRGIALLFVGVGMIAWLAGCGSGGQQTQPTPSISVQFATAPLTSLSTGKSTQLSAAVTGNSSSVDVTWSVTCGTASACGSFSIATTGSGASTTYTAPSTVPAGGTVTITATSVADTTKSVSATITISSASSIPIVVTFYGTPPPISMAPFTSASMSAKVTNDPSSNPQVNWTAKCGSLAVCGSFAPTPTGSEVETIYTSPAGIPLGTSITVTATSVTDPTKLVSATIVIDSPISIAINPTVPASLPTSASIPLSARISSDPSASPQVQWSATCGSSACGSFSAATTGNGTSTTYTAPSAVPAGGTVTVTATSVTDPTKSASASISIVAAVPNPSLPDGNYVYQINGQDGSVMDGVFVAAGGYIVGGEQDSIASEDPNTSQYGTTLDRISGGNYTTSADGSLKITLQFANDGTASFEATPAPHGKGFISGEYSYGTHFSGTLNLQTSTAPPAGGYAVALQGDNGAGASWTGGVLNIDSPGGPSTPGAFSGAGSELDFRAFPASSVQALTISPGTVSVPDQYGRAVINLVSYVPNTTAGVSAYLAGYPLDATHIQLIETSNYYMINDNYPYLGAAAAINGAAIAQGAATGKFTASSLAGSSYVFGGSGYVFQTGNLPEYSSRMAGVVTAQSNGNISGTLSWNNSNGQSTPSPQPFTGTYTVDSEGRVTISNLSTANLGSNLYLYLAGNGQGFVLSNDSASVFQGEAIEQQATPFTAASFNGTYGLNTGAFPFVAAGEDLIGSIAATSTDGMDSLTGSGETSQLTGTQLGTTDFSISGSFTPASNGIFQGSITGVNLLSPATPGDFTLYLVDSTQGFAIQSGNAMPTLVQVQIQ
jgi:hypothetical protein